MTTTSEQLEEEKPQEVGNQQAQTQFANNVVKEARQFLKYTFFKIQPQWRRLPNLEIAQGKDELRNVLKDFENRKMKMKFYSLVGIRGDCDFMVWSFSDTLEELRDFVAGVISTKLGAYLTIPYSYLAMTRPSEYVGTHGHEGREGLRLRKTPGNSKYLFVYPFTKKREWYNLQYEERRKMMAEHFRIGHKYPSVKINTGYSFGLDDQEFMLSFETDYPADFLELVMELRSSDASKYTALETPVFTCVNVTMDGLVETLA